MEREKTKRKKFKRIGVLFLIFVLLEVFLYREEILVAAGKYLVLEHKPRKGEVIVLLNGWPETIVRSRGAADLYKKGLAPKVFVPRRKKMKGWEDLKKRGLKVPEQRDIIIEILQILGVPREAIETSEREVESTWGEAVAVREWVKKRGYRTVLLVTSRFHSRRAWIILQEALKGEAQVISLPTPYDDFDPEGWWRRHKDRRRVIFEYEKLLYHWLMKLKGGVKTSEGG